MKSREYRNETLIITGDAWKFLRRYSAVSRGFKNPTDEQLDKWWDKYDFRNGGASRKTNPISDNEVRISRDSFAIKWDSIKKLLEENGFSYRDDGFCEEGCYLSI